MAGRLLDPARAVGGEQVADSLLRWVRSDRRPPEIAGRPEAPPCWTSGFIGNRAELLGSTAEPQEASEARLLSGLHLRHGEGAVGRIAGPFAFALWDAASDRLIAARDRLGLEGLCYAIAGDTLYAASRPAPILDALGGSARLNRRAVAAHVSGEAPPPGETFFEGVRELEPGSLLVATREGVEVRRYWRIAPRPLLPLRSDQEFAEAFREVLWRVIGEYAPGGELGVTLSGGMDGSTVAASLRAVRPALPLTAFTQVAPELPEADESGPARAICDFLGLPQVRIRADRLWPLRGGLEAVLERDAPLVNAYYDSWEETFARVAERGIRLLFSGLGGDHLFGGNVYAYPDLLLTGRWRELGRQLRRHLPDSELGLAGILRVMILGPLMISYSPFARRRGRPAPWLGEACRGLLHRPAVERLPALLPGRAQRVRLMRDPLAPRMGALMNRHAARHGIGLRHPLIDHRLVDFAAALPTTQTFDSAWRKVVMRNAMRGRLPDEILDAERKTYPEALFRRGLGERERRQVEELTTGMRAAELGFVDEERLRRAYRDFLDGRSRSGLFWYALTLEAWLRRGERRKEVRGDGADG